MANLSIVSDWRTRWNRSLLRFLGKRVPASVDVEDLAQETYLRLLRARDLTDVRHPHAYLLRVAGHVVSEWRDHRPPEDPLSLLDEEEVTQLGGACGLDAELSQLRLDETLQSFAAVTRAVLLLRFRDEYTYKEIAAKLSLTERQVRRHLTRGYEQLRDALTG